jgi:subtilase family serine protease
MKSGSVCAKSGVIVFAVVALVASSWILAEDGVAPTPSPNLIIQSVACPTGATLGSSFTVTYVIKNIGNANAGSSTTYLQLCSDTNNVSGTTCSIHTHTVTGTIAPGAAKTNSPSVTVSNGCTTGIGFVVVVANRSHSVGESNYADNTNACQLSINP